MCSLAVIVKNVFVVQTNGVPTIVSLHSALPCAVTAFRDRVAPVSIRLILGFPRVPSLPFKLRWEFTVRAAPSGGLFQLTSIGSVELL